MYSNAQGRTKYKNMNERKHHQHKTRHRRTQKRVVLLYSMHIRDRTLNGGAFFTPPLRVASTRCMRFRIARERLESEEDRETSAVGNSSASCTDQSFVARDGKRAEMKRLYYNSSGLFFTRAFSDNIEYNPRTFCGWRTH